MSHKRNNKTEALGETGCSNDEEPSHHQGRFSPVASQKVAQQQETIQSSSKQTTTNAFSYAQTMSNNSYVGSTGKGMSQDQRDFELLHTNLQQMLIRQRQEGQEEQAEGQGFREAGLGRGYSSFVGSPAALEAGLESGTALSDLVVFAESLLDVVEASPPRSPQCRLNRRLDLTALVKCQPQLMSRRCRLRTLACLLSWQAALRNMLTSAHAQRIHCQKAQCYTWAIP